MRKRWFNIFMGMFVLLFAGLWIAGCTEETGLEGMKDKHNPDSADETDVVALSGGGSHTIELKSDGTVWIWGSNQFGQLGDGTTIDSPAPIQVIGLTDVTAIAAGGSHTIALKTDGTVWSWGDNRAGQLGVITTEACSGYSTPCSSTPVKVIGLTDIIAIAAGGSHTVALKSDGTVWAWGRNNSGQLGATVSEICGYGYSCSTTPVQVSGLTDVTTIAGGGFHTIALKADGTVWAWGANRYGQLGDGTTIDSTTPMQVRGLTDVTAVAGGLYHTIVLKTDGTVWAWGWNSSGQLGTETTETCEFGSTKWYCSTTPLQVNGLTGVTSIAAGGNLYVGHTIALKADGTVWAWGNNDHGQLGATTTEICEILIPYGERGGAYTYSAFCSTTPVQVSGLAEVNVIAGGGYHTIALKSDDTVWAWGDNEHSQLGVTTTETCGYEDDFNCSSAPVQARSKVTGAFSVGGTVSDLTETLVLQNNGEDDLIITENGPFTFATELEDLAVYDIEILTQPDGQVCEIISTISGRINATDVTDIQITCLDFFTEAIAIAGGNSHTIALKTDGTVWAWGKNNSGQLGVETTETCGNVNCSTIPVEVNGLTDVVTIAAGGVHTIVLESDGTVWAWGNNWTGQLGDGTTINSPTPRQVDLTDVNAIAAGWLHTIALKSDGTVWAWGSNQYGQLGATTSETCGYSSTPCSTTSVQVIGLTDVTAIAAGDYHTVALKTDGTVWAWGRNYSGQLGDGTTTDSATPVQVSDLTDVIAIAAGDYHTVAIKTDGTVWAWGSNWSGQLGDGTTINSTTPVQVNDLTDVTAIAAGDYHTVAIRTDGTVWAWGKNNFGQLGDGTKTNSTTPVQVSGLTDVTVITAGDDHAVVFKSDGTVWAWGFNRYGQLGDATTTDRYTPVQVLVTP
jgi:alpha-tubulin suppressor-like RCC1 family protein